MMCGWTPSSAMPVAQVRRRSCKRQGARSRRWSRRAFASAQSLKPRSPPPKRKSEELRRGKRSRIARAWCASGNSCRRPFLVRSGASTITACGEVDLGPAKVANCTSALAAARADGRSARTAQCRGSQPEPPQLLGRQHPLSASAFVGFGCAQDRVGVEQSLADAPTEKGRERRTGTVAADGAGAGFNLAQQRCYLPLADLAKAQPMQWRGSSYGDSAQAR